jgi:surface protein
MFKPTNKKELQDKIKKIVSGGNAPESWDLTNISDFSKLFDRVIDFDKLGFIENWNVSHVTKMTSMFKDCSVFNIPLNNWDVSKVTDMSSMFEGCYKFNQPLNNWNVSNVRDMSYMFFGNNNKFNQSLNDWNVSNVKNMSYMFQGCVMFNQLLNNWNVYNVEKMAHMFTSCSSFDKPLNNWNVSNVRDMSYMFQRCYMFNQPLNNWNVSNVRDMSYMFQSCIGFNQPLNNWVISRGTIFTNIFLDSGMSQNNMPDRLLPPEVLKRKQAQQQIAEAMRLASQLPVDDREQPFPRCVICDEFLNNIDGQGPNEKCQNNCNDVVNVCENNHLFHRGCILNSCNAERVDVASQMGFNQFQSLQNQSISTICPICRQPLLPSCEGLRDKEKVPTENIDENGLIKKGGRRIRRKTQKKYRKGIKTKRRKNKRRKTQKK